jgi:hypothetical protein
MKLSEAINLAQYGELNSLAVAKNTEAVISFINLALIELYNLFSLRTGETIIRTKPGVYTYQVPADFMYIVSAYTRINEEVKELAVNEEKNVNSINMVGYDKVQIPFSDTVNVVSLLYVQRPVQFTIDDLDEEIPLPPQMLQAMFCYVAYKAHGAVRLDGQSEGDIYFLRFKRLVDDLRHRGTPIASDDLSMDDRLRMRGFP